MKWFAVVLKFSDLPIGTKLFLILSGTIFFLVMIAGISHYTISKVVNEDIKTIEVVRHSSEGILQLRRMEKDFFLRETTNTKFFTTGESGYISNYENVFTETMQNLESIKKFEQDSGDIEGVERIVAAQEALTSYRAGFIAATRMLRERGFGEYGLAGKVGASAAELAKETRKALGREETYSDLLEAIETEKNYFNTHSDEAARDFLERLGGVEESIESSTAKPEKKAGMLGLLEDYRKNFNALVAADREIGFTFESGIQREFLTYANRAERIVDEEGTDMREDINRLTGRATTNIIALIVMAILFTLITGIIIVRSIVGPIKKLTSAIDEISRGNPEAKIGEELKESKDEIGALARAFNRTMVSLKMSMEADPKKRDKELVKRLQEEV